VQKNGMEYFCVIWTHREWF